MFSFSWHAKGNLAQSTRHVAMHDWVSKQNTVTADYRVVLKRLKNLWLEELKLQNFQRVTAVVCGAAREKTPVREKEIPDLINSDRSKLKFFATMRVTRKSPTK